MGAIIVALIRIFIPLIILRYPLLGGTAALILDAVDIELINTFGFWDDFDNKHIDYQVLDKYLDMFYITLELYILLSFQNKLVKNVGIALYVLRLIGFVFFELADKRLFLFLFPNLFEYFFIFYLAHKKILKRDLLTSYRNLTIVLVALLIPKLIQEYIAHIEVFPIWTSIKQSLGIKVVNP